LIHSSLDTAVFELNLVVSAATQSGWNFRLKIVSTRSPF